MSEGATSLSDTAPPNAPAPASLIVVDPNGQRSRVELAPIPFNIGRQPGNHYVVRDSRASRTHARIVIEGLQYAIEDNGSRHGVFVNGTRVAERQPLKSADRIDFGINDSYHFYFAMNEDAEGILRPTLTIDDSSPHTTAVRGPAGAGQNLPKLRAVLEVARTLQRSFSLEDVLNSVVDAALAVTGAERGFLLLSEKTELIVRCARDRNNEPLSPDDLRVPRRVIHRALKNRRELLAMNFDPHAGDDPGSSVADLELRSVVCVPLVRIAATATESTQRITMASETVGVLYLDSRSITADLSGGNRELLQTLAIEASTVLENARLLHEERVKQKMEEELEVARTIQQNLLPQSLPSTGWFKACGSSVASHQVGGDYFDVLPVSDDCWAVIIADVSGKGVSSALLAALLQGAFLAASDDAAHLEGVLTRINAFLSLRPEAEKYATVFCALIRRNGEGVYINAGHCAPIVVGSGSALQTLAPTTFPVGLIEGAEYRVQPFKLEPGDKVVAYTDGVTEAQNSAGEFFGTKRLNEKVKAGANVGCEALHHSIRAAVADFTEGAPQSDDITLLVLGFGEW
jgi:sigma-B regulation protein RsbU (phosphoserine phosphatase)